MTLPFPVPSPSPFLHEILDLPMEINPYSALHNASYALFKCQQLATTLIPQYIHSRTKMSGLTIT